MPDTPRQTRAERIIDAVVAQLQTEWPAATNGVRITSEDELTGTSPWISVVYRGDQVEEVQGDSSIMSMPLVVEAHEIAGDLQDLQRQGLRLIGRLKQVLAADRSYLRGVALPARCYIEASDLKLPDENQRAIAVAVTFSITFTERASNLYR